MYKTMANVSGWAMATGFLLMIVGGLTQLIWHADQSLFIVGLVIVYIGMALDWLATKGRTVALYKKIVVSMGLFCILLVSSAEQFNLPGLGYLHRGAGPTPLGLVVGVGGALMFMVGLLMVSARKVEQ